MRSAHHARGSPHTRVWQLAACGVALAAVAGRIHNAFAHPPLFDYDGAGHATNVFSPWGGEPPRLDVWSGCTSRAQLPDPDLLGRSLEVCGSGPMGEMFMQRFDLVRGDPSALRRIGIEQSGIERENLGLAFAAFPNERIRRRLPEAGLRP